MRVDGKHIYGLKKILTWAIAMILTSISYGFVIHAQDAPGASQLVQRVVHTEQEAFQHQPQYIYTSLERSERTGGHVWTERVADLAQGKLRYLVEEDGRALADERRQRELARVKRIAADPETFVQNEKSRMNDEQHAQQMLTVLAHAFTFEDTGKEGSWRRLNYKPNPSYNPRGYEEKVICGMSGKLLVDEETNRLHYLEGKLQNDVIIGWGVIGTVHRGSAFSMNRDRIAPTFWKTTQIDTNIDGRILFLKSVGSHQHALHKDFKALASYITVQQAADLITRTR